MPKILASYAPLSRQNVTININTTTWTVNASTSVTLTATLETSGEPYSGTASITYSNLSGPSDVNFQNGSASLSVTRPNNASNSTITVTIPKSNRVNESTITFTGTLSGQSLYIEGNTYWRNDNYVGCTCRTTILVNGAQLYRDTGHCGDTYLAGHNRGDQVKQYNNGLDPDNLCNYCVTTEYGVRM